MNFLFFGLLATISIAEPEFSIPAYIFTDPIDGFVISSLYPVGQYFARSNMKPKLNYGTPSTRILELSDHIESIPTETRLDIMSSLRSTKLRKQMLPFTSTWYGRYVLSSMFIDIRVLKLLIRVAFKRLDFNERNLDNACAIIEYLREKLPNSDFEYLTPEYILEWYDLLGGAQHDWNVPRIDRFNPFTIQISYPGWKRTILDKRIRRLASSGYETLQIDNS